MGWNSDTVFKFYFVGVQLVPSWSEGRTRVICKCIVSTKREIIVVYLVSCTRPVSSVSTKNEIQGTLDYTRMTGTSHSWGLFWRLPHTYKVCVFCGILDIKADMTYSVHRYEWKCTHTRTWLWKAHASCPWCKCKGVLCYSEWMNCYLGPVLSTKHKSIDK